MVPLGHCIPCHEFDLGHPLHQSNPICVIMSKRQQASARLYVLKRRQNRHQTGLHVPSLAACVGRRHTKIASRISERYLYRSPLICAAARWPGQQSSRLEGFQLVLGSRIAACRCRRRLGQQVRTGQQAVPEPVEPFNGRPRRVNGGFVGSTASRRGSPQLSP